MAPKGGTCFLLLTLACTALAMSSTVMPSDFKDMAKKMMRKCQDEGYPVPKMAVLKTVFNNSDMPMENRNTGQTNTLLSTFESILDSVSLVKGSLSRPPLDDSDKMTNMMKNCSYLATMIKMMRNSSDTSACYMQAFMAPLSWMTLTTQSEKNMESDDYDTLLWAAKPALQDMLPSRMKLPVQAEPQNVKKMMKMLQEMYDPMSEDQNTQVVKWAKQQITQNYFNCTMTPLPDSRLKLMETCKSTVKWLSTEALTMLGPYLSRLAPNDVDSSPKEKLCEFFRLAQFKSALKMTTAMNPSLAKKFLQKFQECFSAKEFAQHLDKLGPLACYYYTVPDLSPELSKQLLSELDNCNNPRIEQLKNRLVKSVISKSNTAKALLELGSSVTLLSPKQLSEVSGNDLKEILKNLGPAVQWTRGQLRALVKKQLGNIKCKNVSGEELKALQTIAGGLPRCLLKKVKAREILNDTEALRNISRSMRKGQLKAMLQGLREGVDPSELVQKLDGALLHCVSLSNLAKANITSLDQVENKMWSLPQAAYLAKKMDDLKQLKYRGSVLQGITCKMIDKIADGDVQQIAQAIAGSSQWLSKVQAGCAARKLFSTLENQRADFFKTITLMEMDNIPTFLLLQLPPLKVKDLPDSVCPVFLNKMEEANLTSLPHRAPSRLALAQRALLCLGNDLSGLTTEDVSRLGPLLCELQPSQLRLMAPNVLNSSLQAMASCQHIPQHHRADLIQLVNQTFGDASDWSAETMEELGPLLLLDDNSTSALPKKPWMKDVLYFLKSRLTQTSDALEKKIFDLTTTVTTTTSNTVRKKRTASSISDHVGNGNSSSNSGTDSAKVPSVELIEELGMDNIYWTAAQLDQMSTETFLATVETLGKIPDYSADQLAVLSKKATEAFGPVSAMNETAVTQMGCINQGFSDADLEKLPFSLDTLEEIDHCGWSESQMEPVWKAVAKYNNLTAEQLGATEMVSLSQFICGLNSREIGQLNMDAFKDAVGSMDGVQCSFNVTRQLTNLAVSAFGDPSTWTEAQVADLGNIIAGLDATELAALDASVFSFISKSCIPLIPSTNFAALSAAQLQALGPDNIAMVTSEQLGALGSDQLAALESTLTGAREQTQNSGQSGAPSLTVEGMSAYMKPLLFLLTGFLLL
ncbi:otoancorin isoform X2 [Dicentrarchus labrax]|uniref:Otoancorin n=1 Tax=Dicentrarchus labrax TaxID=13489 RepID=A0A8P4K102_DICLA|nr:otoancorin isoform X2 [Dicentrarchus labrax]